MLKTSEGRYANLPFRKIKNLFYWRNKQWQKKNLKETNRTATSAQSATLTTVKQP
jgi:hypothetical protein